jgi:hypothetical protein
VHKIRTGGGTMAHKKGSVKRERSDQEKLKLFVQRVEDLAKTTLAQKGMNPGLHYHATQVSFEIELVEPDEEEFRSFLVTFRQFISEEEPVFLSHIYNICSRRVVSDELKDLVVGSRKIWADTQKVSGIQLIIDGTEMPAREIWKIWINGRYFHNDLRYQQILDQASPVALKVLRFDFLTFVGKAGGCIAWLSGFVDQALNDNLFIFE